MRGLKVMTASCLKSDAAFGAFSPGNWKTDMSSVPKADRSSWTGKLDPELFHVGKIGTPAFRREHTIIEENIGIDGRGENHSSHDQICAHEPRSILTTPQAG